MKNDWSNYSQMETENYRFRPKYLGTIDYILEFIHIQYNRADLNPNKPHPNYDLEMVKRPLNSVDIIRHLTKSNATKSDTHFPKVYYVPLEIIFPHSLMIAVGFDSNGRLDLQIASDYYGDERMEESKSRIEEVLDMELEYIGTD